MDENDFFFKQTIINFGSVPQITNTSVDIGNLRNGTERGKI